MSSNYQYAVLIPKPLASIVRVLCGGDQIRPILVVTPPTKVRYG